MLYIDTEYAPEICSLCKGAGHTESRICEACGEVARFWLHSRQETVLSAVERDTWAPISAGPAEEAVGHCFEEVH